MTHTLHVADALLGPEFTPAGPTEIRIEGGRIAAIGPAPAGAAVSGLAMPAPVNAHDHARPLSTASFGLAGEPLETWLLGLGAMPAVDAGLAARAAFARAASGGVAASMVHLTRPMGLVPLPEEAAQIVAAADAVGIRIALALSLRDRNPLVYGDHAPIVAAVAERDGEVAARLAAALARPMPAVDAQIAMVAEVAAALGDRGDIVQFGPTGPQWCSPELLEAVADASARTGRRVHMHLLETKYQRAWADAEHPGGVVQWLDRIGLLSPRLTLAHCAWARPEELEILAAAGVTVAVNSSSNLHLASGIAPVREMLARGVRVAMGIDGCALDDDDDALREVRLLRLLHAGPGLDGGMTQDAALRAACGTGRPSLGLPEGGVLEVGAPADMVVLDLAALDRDQLLPVNLKGLMLTRARREHLRELWVGGRQVIAGGRMLGLDAQAAEEDLRAAFRAALPGTAVFRGDWPTLRPAVAAFYRERLGCC